MIFQNGYISFIFNGDEGGGLDADGYRIEPKAIYSTPYPCHWRHINQNLQGIVQGEHFELAEYEVIIPIDESIWKPKEAILTLDDEDRTEIARKPVRALDHLRLVRRTKLFL